LINKETFQSRHDYLARPVHDAFLGSKIVKFVETISIYNDEQVTDAFLKFTSQGYEGLMLRNSESLYVNKRSYDLQKVKEFNDSEFDIIGVEEGCGKLAGHVGAFICCPAGDITNHFNAKMKGDTARLKEYFDNHSLWQGKKLTVQYQGLTAYGIPRFPVGIAIRDYE
jgi:ATP-dependent DNA ligase